MIDRDHNDGPPAPSEDRPRLREVVTVRFEIPADDLTEQGLRSLLDECHLAAEVSVKKRLLTDAVMSKARGRAASRSTGCCGKDRHAWSPTDSMPS